MLRLGSGNLTEADAQAAYEAGQRVVAVHRRLVEFLRVGQTLAQIDHFVYRTLEDLGCRSCFYMYRQPRLPAFPSYACLSVNDCIVHGTAGYYEAPMKEGDILKIDIGVVYRGWIGDAAWTYVFKGYPSDEARRLMEAGKVSLERGIREMTPGRQLIHWAETVQKTVEEEYGFHLVRGLGGHGYFRKKLHEAPFISNVVPSDFARHRGSFEWPDALRPWHPGTIVAVEPMVALGTSRTVSRPREWPVFTADGSLSVHYEHDVLVTEEGPKVLTEGLEGMPDIVG